MKLERTGPSKAVAGAASNPTAQAVIELHRWVKASSVGIGAERGAYLEMQGLPKLTSALEHEFLSGLRREAIAIAQERSWAVLTRLGEKLELSGEARGELAGYVRNLRDLQPFAAKEVLPKAHREERPVEKRVRDSRWAVELIDGHLRQSAPTRHRGARVGRSIFERGRGVGPTFPMSRPAWSKTPPRWRCRWVGI